MFTRSDNDPLFFFRHKKNDLKEVPAGWPTGTKVKYRSPYGACTRPAPTLVAGTQDALLLPEVFSTSLMPRNAADVRPTRLRNLQHAVWPYLYRSGFYSGLAAGRKKIHHDPDRDFNLSKIGKIRRTQVGIKRGNRHNGW